MIQVLRWLYNMKDKKIPQDMKNIALNFVELIAKADKNKEKATNKSTTKVNINKDDI